MPLTPLSLLSSLAVLRTLMGHKANICSLDFHPYGEFVASGSQDTNIKVRPCLCPVSPTGPAVSPGLCVQPEERAFWRCGRASSHCGGVYSLRGRGMWKSSPDASAQNAQLSRAVSRFLSFWGVMTWGARKPSPLVGACHPLSQAPGRGLARPLQPKPTSVGTCPDSAPLLFSPQLWDIRRKGCVFRYRVRKEPFGDHSMSSMQAWTPG